MSKGLRFLGRGSLAVKALVRNLKRGESQNLDPRFLRYLEKKAAANQLSPVSNVLLEKDSKPINQKHLNPSQDLSKIGDIDASEDQNKISKQPEFKITTPDYSKETPTETLVRYFSGYDIKKYSQEEKGLARFADSRLRTLSHLNDGDGFHQGGAIFDGKISEGSRVMALARCDSAFFNLERQILKHDYSGVVNSYECCGGKIKILVAKSIEDKALGHGVFAVDSESGEILCRSFVGKSSESYRMNFLSISDPKNLVKFGISEFNICNAALSGYFKNLGNSSERENFTLSCMGNSFFFSQLFEASKYGSAPEMEHQATKGEVLIGEAAKAFEVKYPDQMGESGWYEKGRGTFGLKPTADFDFMKKISAEVASKAGIELRKIDIAGSKKAEQSAEDFVQQTKINTARDSEMKKKDTTAQAFESRNRSYLPKSATSSRRGSSCLSKARGKNR